MTRTRSNRLKVAGISVATATLFGSGALFGAAGPAIAGLLDADGDTTLTAPPAGGSGAAVVPSLGALNEAFAATAARVKSSVVYITAEQPERVARGGAPGQRPGQLELPPEFRRFFEMPGAPPMGMPEGGDPEARPRRGQSSGSGFIISRDGYVLTNAHVVDGAERVTVRLLDRREYPAKVIGTDPATDVAVLKVEATGLTPAPLGSSETARVGEWVLAVGNPLGERLTFTVTSGIISAKGRALDLPNSSAQSIQDFIQTDAAINPGNSGGPLVNMQGEVIGINTAIASPTGTYAGYGFAVPIDLVRQVKDQLIAHGTVHRAALGISVLDAGANDATYAGLPEIRGVVVQDFGASSPAKAAGLVPGDVIVAVDGKRVDYVGQLQERIAFRKPGEQVAVEVARKGGQRVTIRVPLERVPDAAAARRTVSDDRSAPGNARERGAEIAPLGVTVAPVDEATARSFELPNDARGVVVTGVQERGPGAGRLAAPGEGGPDVVLSVEGRAVRSPAELRDAVSRLRSGDVVTLRVYNARLGTHRIERVRVG